MRANSKVAEVNDQTEKKTERYLHVSSIGGWDLVGIPPSSDLDIEAYSSWSINSSEFILEKLVGSRAFFSLSVDVDDKNSSVSVLTVNRALV